MKLLLTMFLLSTSAALAQQSMESTMPGMQMPSASNPAAPSTAEPNPLAEAATRPALTLDELLASARTHNPTLQTAQAAIAENAGRAKQAGLWPNLVLGYEGDQIRGGSYGGGEQGACLQQTIPLGGKLGRRRDIYQAQQRTSELTL